MYMNADILLRVCSSGQGGYSVAREEYILHLNPPD